MFKVGRNHQIEKALKTSCDGTCYISRAHMAEISSIQIDLGNIEAFLMPSIWSVNCTPKLREGNQGKHQCFIEEHWC